MSFMVWALTYLIYQLGTHLALAAEANRVSAIFTNRVYMYTDNCLMQTACRQAAPPPLHKSLPGSSCSVPGYMIMLCIDICKSLDATLRITTLFIVGEQNLMTFSS